MSYTLEQLAEHVGGEILGDGQISITDGESLHKAAADQISFVAEEKHLASLKKTEAGAVLMNRSLQENWQQRSEDCRAVLVLVEDAHESFTRIVLKIHPPRQRAQVGISPKAILAETVQIGSGTNIHPGAVIEDDVVIGDRCEILPGAVIGTGSVLGDDVVIHPNTVLYADTIIGNRVTIHANSVIGADGYGYRVHEGRHRKVPQMGRVRIQDDVEIGSCTTIDRASIGETIIGMGTKIDNLVQIAHNCTIGQHNLIVGHCGLAGSVTTGDYVVMAGQAGIADHVTIGDGAILGSKIGVMSDLPGGETYLGAPATKSKEALRAIMAYQKGPKTLAQVKSMEKQIYELTQRLAALESPADHTEEKAA